MQIRFLWPGRLLRFSIGLLLAAGVGSAMAETHRYIPPPGDLKYVFATAPPVLHLKPGDRLVTWTESALGDHLNKPGDTLPSGFRPNPNTGPLSVEV